MGKKKQINTVQSPESPLINTQCSGAARPTTLAHLLISKGDANRLPSEVLYKGKASSLQAAYGSKAPSQPCS